jgi:hypothetical protein
LLSVSPISERPSGQGRPLRVCQRILLALVRGRTTSDNCAEGNRRAVACGLESTSDRLTDGDRVCRVPISFVFPDARKRRSYPTTEECVALFQSIEGGVQLRNNGLASSATTIASTLIFCTASEYLCLQSYSSRLQSRPQATRRRTTSGLPTTQKSGFCVADSTPRSQNRDLGRLDQVVDSRVGPSVATSILLSKFHLRVRIG